MTGLKKAPTHEDRERAFANLFGTVRADGAGTGMGSTDQERDKALGHVTFDQIPEKPIVYEVPDVPKPKVEHASLRDDLSRNKVGWGRRIGFGGHGLEGFRGIEQLKKTCWLGERRW